MSGGKLVSTRFFLGAVEIPDELRIR